jgi:hypothetical protein
VLLLKKVFPFYGYKHMLPARSRQAKKGLKSDPQLLKLFLINKTSISINLNEQSYNTQIIKS